jgi:hypothetical protein
LFGHRGRIRPEPGGDNQEGRQPAGRNLPTDSAPMRSDPAPLRRSTAIHHVGHHGKSDLAMTGVLTFHDISVGCRTSAIIAGHVAWSCPPPLRFW